MKREKISEAMGNISSRHIKEAAEFKAEEKPHRKKNVWMKWVSLAACFCLIVVAAFAFIPMLNNGNGDGDETIDNVLPTDIDKIITNTGKVQTTIEEEASLPQFMSLEVEKHNALSNNNTISVDVYMGYIILNKDGAAFSDIVVPEEEFEDYTFVVEINYNNETREVATHNLNYFEEYECDMYQGVVHYNKYNTVQFDIDKMTGKSYGFVNVELYMISNANQRYFVSAQTLYYSVTETELVFGLVSNPVANEGDLGIITKGWEYVEPSNSDINNDSGDAPNTPDTPKNLCGHTSSIQKADADVFDCGVFYAGYYLPDSLVENSLNFDKLANSRLDRALIYKFDTYEEYNAFKAQYEENLNFELLSYITKDYFEENTLVLAYEIVNNSTYRYMATGIYIEEEKICVHIKETTNAEFVDYAMSGWFFAVTIDKTITDDINEYDAIIEG